MTLREKNNMPGARAGFCGLRVLPPCTSILVLAVACALSAPVLAQDAGSILRETERATGKNQAAPAPLAPMTVPPAEQALPERTGQTVFVKSFRIRSSVLPPEELGEVVKSYLNKRLTMGDLQAVARKLSEYCRQKGKLAHAYLPPQTVRDGEVEIVVLEGKLGKVKIDPSSKSRLNPERATGMIQYRVEPGKPLDFHDMDEAVAILNDVPGVSAMANLRAGEAEGETDAVIKLEDKPVASGSLTSDTGGSTSTGVVRVLGSASIDDPFGEGERLSLVGLATMGSRYARIAAQMPVGLSGLAVGINASALEYEVGGRFESLDLHGSSWSLGSNASYPLLRSTDFSLTLSTTYDYKELLDKAGNSELNEKKLHVATLGLSATANDAYFGGGKNSLALTGSLGHLNLDGVPSSAAVDRTTAGTAGYFAKLLGSATRQQDVAQDWTLITTLEAQITGSNLDSSEKFSLGGLDRVRAYPSGEGSGDSGARLALDLRWQATDDLKLSAFYDVGYLLQHTDPWPNWQPKPDQPNSYVLHGAGLGLTWSPKQNIQLSAIVAKVFGRNAGSDVSGNDSDGHKHRYRGWLQASLSF